MSGEFFRTLVAYHYWARDRLMRAVERVPEAEYLAARPMDYGSIHNTLAHTLGAEVVWHSRWGGVSPARIPGGADFASLAALMERWRQQEAHVRSYLDNLDDVAIMSTVVNYRSTEGKEFSRQLWETFLHLINHGTHHRSEVAAAVTQLGHSPGDLDLIAFLNRAELGLS